MRLARNVQFWLTVSGALPELGQLSAQRLGSWWLRWSAGYGRV